MITDTTHRLETVALSAPAAGTSLSVQFHHYGTPGQGSKAYLHAALHADETPGLLVMQKLLGLLDAADKRGEISGHIIAAPFANPIGLNQYLLGRQQGRFYSGNGKNFNREFPDISGAVAELIGGELTDNAVENVTHIRAACRQVLAAQSPASVVDELKHVLISRSIDADYVFDLHCDSEAVLYLFALPELERQASELAAWLGCDAALMAAPSSAGPFDEANSALWLRLRKRFPKYPIPPACMSTTIELRGRTDVDEAVAERDALGMYKYLQANGLIIGEPEPPTARCKPTPFDGVGQVLATQAGVVSFCKQLGEHVEKNDVVARLHSLDKDSTPCSLLASTSGIIFSRISHRYVEPGIEVCSIAGSKPLKQNIGKDLLSD